MRVVGGQREGEMGAPSRREGAYWKEGTISYQYGNLYNTVYNICLGTLAY